MISVYDWDAVGKDDFLGEGNGRNNDGKEFALRCVLGGSMLQFGALCSRSSNSVARFEGRWLGKVVQVGTTCQAKVENRRDWRFFRAESFRSRPPDARLVR